MYYVESSQWRVYEHRHDERGQGFVCIWTVKTEIANFGNLS